MKSNNSDFKDNLTTQNEEEDEEDDEDDYYSIEDAYKELNKKELGRFQLIHMFAQAAMF